MLHSICWTSCSSSNSVAAGTAVIALVRGVSLAKSIGTAGEKVAQGLEEQKEITNEKVNKELNFLDENKINHIINGSKKLGHNHKWERLQVMSLKR